MTDKVMVITGASSGFGELAARMAADRGYRVVVTARRAERLNDLVQTIETKGGVALAVPGDVTNAEDQQRLIDRTIERFGRIDVLVNNAGLPLPEDFTNSPVDELRRQWTTNTTSLIELTKRALPALIEARGVVINIGSTASHFSVPGWGLYFPSKAAVASISDALRRELRPHGVKVCLVEPGPYRTEFAERAGASTEQSQMFGLPPQQVVSAILRLAERPRRLAVVPFWLGPLVHLGGGLMRLLPGLVDLVFWLNARRQQRQRQPAATT